MLLKITLEKSVIFLIYLKKKKEFRILGQIKTNYLETTINKTIQAYHATNEACLYKRPANFVCLKRLPHNHYYGFYKQKSTCDYYGIWKGYYVEFEAKETKQNSFYLVNVKKHQIEQLKKVAEHQGISFLILSFITEGKYFAFEYEKLANIIEQHKAIDFQKACSEGIEVLCDPTTKRLDLITIFDLLRQQLSQPIKLG